MKGPLIFMTLFIFVQANESLRKSFEPIAALTNQFLNTIQPHDNLKKIMTNVGYDYIKSMNSNSPSISSAEMNKLREMWKMYIGYLILLTIGILFILFFTLIGCICCCCATCCNKKAKNEIPKNALVKLYCYNLFIFILVSLMAIGGIIAVCSCFIMMDATLPRAQSQDKDRNIYNNIDRSLKSFNNFLSNMNKNFQIASLVSIENTYQQLNRSLTSITNTFVTNLFKEINLDGIITTGRKLDKEIIHLSNLGEPLEKNSTEHLKLTETLVSLLNASSIKLTKALEPCKNSTNGSCTYLNNSLSDLKLGFNKENVNQTIDIVLGQMSKELKFTDLKTSIDKLEKSKIDAENKLKTDTSQKLQGFTNMNISSSLGSLASSLNDTTKSLSDTPVTIMKTLDTVSYNVTMYMKYGYYGSAGLMSSIFLICLLFYIGLCFGVCGGPTYEDKSSCNKGIGRNFYIAALFFAVFFSWIICILTSLMFVSGGLIETEMCRYTSVTASAEYMKTVDSVIGNMMKFFLPGNITLGDVTIVVPYSQINLYSGIITKCPKGETLMKSISLPDSFITNITIAFVSTIKPSLEKAINALKNEKISFSEINLNNLKEFSKLVDLNQNSSTTTIPELKKPVTSLKNSTRFFIEIRTLAAYWNSTGNSAGDALLSSVKGLEEKINELQKVQIDYLSVKENSSNAINEIDKLIKLLNSTSSKLGTKTNQAINDGITEIKRMVFSKTEELINGTLNNMSNGIGGCKSLYEALDFGVGVVCRDIIIPYNNIWMGLGWFLLFIIPTLIIAFVASRLYILPYIKGGVDMYNIAYMPNEHFKKPHKKAIKDFENDYTESIVPKTSEGDITDLWSFTSHFRKSKPVTKKKKVPKIKIDKSSIMSTTYDESLSKHSNKTRKEKPKKEKNVHFTQSSDVEEMKPVRRKSIIIDSKLGLNSPFKRKNIRIKKKSGSSSHSKSEKSDKSLLSQITVDTTTRTIH